MLVFNLNLPLIHYIKHNIVDINHVIHSAGEIFLFTSNLSRLIWLASTKWQM